MQGVKGTRHPGQHGTFTNRRPRRVMAGGIVRFEGNRYRHSRLEPFAGHEVIVDECAMQHSHVQTVAVYVCTYQYGMRNGRRACYRGAGTWIADAEIMAPG